MKEKLSLWEARWNIEPRNCIKDPVAWLWFVPLFLMFKITGNDWNIK